MSLYKLLQYAAGTCYCVIAQKLSRGKLHCDGHLTRHVCCEQVMKAGTSEGQRRRLGEGGLVVAVDARSQRLLRYEENGTRGAAALDAHCWGERDAVEVRTGRFSGPAMVQHYALLACLPGTSRWLAGLPRAAWTTVVASLHGHRMTKAC